MVEPQRTMHTPPQEGPSHAENPPFQHAPPLYCCFTVCLANPQNCHLDMPLSPHIGNDCAQTPTTLLILTLAFGCLFLARTGCRCSIVAVWWTYKHCCAKGARQCLHVRMCACKLSSHFPYSRLACLSNVSKLLFLLCWPFTSQASPPCI